MDGVVVAQGENVTEGVPEGGAELLLLFVMERERVKEAVFEPLTLLLPLLLLK